MRHARTAGLGKPARLTTVEWAMVAGVVLAVLALTGEGFLYLRAGSGRTSPAAAEVAGNGPAASGPAAAGPSAAASNARSLEMAKADAAAKADVSHLGAEVATFYIDATKPITPRDLVLVGGHYQLTGIELGRASTGMRSVNLILGGKALAQQETHWCVEVAYDGGTRPVVSYSAQLGLVLSACADQTAALAREAQAPEPTPVRTDFSPRSFDTLAKSDVATLGREVATYFVDATNPMHAADVAIVGGRYVVAGADIGVPVTPGAYAPTVLFVPGGKTIHQQSDNWCVELTYSGGTRSVVSYSAQMGLVVSACADQADQQAQPVDDPALSTAGTDFSPRSVDTIAKSDVSTVGKEVATYFVDADKPMAASGVAIVSGRYVVNGFDIGVPVSPGAYSPTVQFLPGGTTLDSQSTNWCVQLTYSGGTRPVVSYSAQQGLMPSGCPQ